VQVELRADASPTRAVACTFTSRGGRALPPITLHLRSLEDPDRRLELDAPPDTSPSRRHELVLPDGAWRVAPHTGSGLVFDPPWRTCTRADPELHFELLDDSPSRPLVVRAFDACTGEPLEQARVTLLLDPARQGARRAAEHAPPLRPRALPFGARALEHLPDEVELHWLVEAEGYRSRQGARAALRRSGEELRLEVQLEPSWRARFLIAWRDEQGREHPLPGVRLETSAGRVLGESLGDGELSLELA
jgi:hypothetical protein